ncbi:MAG: hypothetical protein AAGI92_03845 [Pseudomonadota bacterium]
MSASVALAEEVSVPEFLEGTAVFSRDLRFCPGAATPSDLDGTIQINRAGVFGYEIGCTFLEFTAERDPESGELLSWQATAQCSDDSGITRPDQLAIIHFGDDNLINLQSQNEYVVGELLARIGQDPLEANTLSGVYSRCPNY